MIKKHELRIGNIVNCHFLTTNFNAEVLEVRHGGVMVQDGEYQNVYGYDNISPLPISPEILEKAGFINQVGKVSIFERGRLRIYTGLKRSLCYLIEEDTTEAHYIPIVLESLHQLQNLFFALTGEELTIQL